jgi:hypothetical protein
VQSMGFGSLFNLHPQIKFPRMLVLCLLTKLDAEISTLCFRIGENFPVSQADVQLVLGLPHTHKNI